MILSNRNWMVLAIATTLFLSVNSAQAQTPAKLNPQQLGQVIQSLGLPTKQVEQRFDFEFKAKLNDEQWDLSMSAVLSQDGSALWVMAWLDELPKSAADVPRTALLRLLAENDKMGNGKFFAYIPTNRRFILQRVVPNEDLDAAKVKSLLQDLGATVVSTYPQWAVVNWTSNPAAAAAKPAAAAKTSTQPAPLQSAANESKFERPIRK